jgi:biotin operon repressor
MQLKLGYKPLQNVQMLKLTGTTVEGAQTFYTLVTTPVENVC